MQYIDGGSAIHRDERLGMLAGWQPGGSFCFGFCLGRFYSPQESGPPIGTWFVGIGAVGASFAPVGHSWHIGNVLPHLQPQKE